MMNNYIKYHEAIAVAKTTFEGILDLFAVLFLVARFEIFDCFQKPTLAGGSLLAVSFTSHGACNYIWSLVPCSGCVVSLFGWLAVCLAVWLGGCLAASLCY